MLRTLRIEPTDPRPIWRQIEEGLRHLVACGAISAGAAVPSVRDLARELQVNPATVSKAYQRLTDAGVLSVKRGEGTYVNGAPPALSAEARDGLLLEAARRFAATAATLGATREEAVASVETAWHDLAAGPAGEPS